MSARVTLFVVAVIVVIVTVGVILLVAPGPVNESLSLLMPMKR
jgi:hypothetical protein